MERYASSLSRLLAGASSPAVIQAPDTFDTLSERGPGRPGRATTTPSSSGNAVPRPTTACTERRPTCPSSGSLADIQALVGWTAELLAELDDLYAQTRARLAEETAAYRPQSVALSLF